MQEKNELRRQFSQRFTEAVRKSNIMQKELALYVNITEQTLSKYKKGDRIPDSEELYRLAKFFGVTMDWLLGADEASAELEWKRRALAAESKLKQICEVLPLLSDVNTKLAKIVSGKE